LRYNLTVMGDESDNSRAADRFVVFAATAAVAVALGGALLELCYTLFRW